MTRIWISISDLNLNSIIESHDENLKNLLNFILIIKMANGMGSFPFFGFISRPIKFPLSIKKKKGFVNVTGEAEKLQSGGREGPVVPSCWSRFVNGIRGL